MQKQKPTFKIPVTEVRAWSSLYVACSFFLEQSSLASLLNENVSESLDIFVSVFRTPRGSVFARIFEFLHQIRFWNQESCNLLLDQQWFRFELPRLFDLGKNLLKIFHGCVFFPFFQARSYNSVEKVDTWCFPFFLSFLFCINNFFLQKNFCVFATLSRHTHKFSDCSLQERDRCPEETMRTTCCDVNR